MKDFNVVGQLQSFDKRVLDAATELVNFIHRARILRQPIHVILKYVYAHGSIQANVLHHRSSIATVILDRFDYVRFVIRPVESIVHEEVNGKTVGRVQVIADEQFHIGTIQIRRVNAFRTARVYPEH
jgi:hypothetical protein